MKNKLLIFILTLTFISCGLGNKSKSDMTNQKDQQVKIETTLGDIVVKLYNDTPAHRDNFIKLVKDETYHGTLFHRVIKNFMIQAGDPESKNAPKDKMLGAGDVVILSLLSLYILSTFIRKGLFLLHVKQIK